MLSVYSPLQLEPTSSFPFHAEMRSSLGPHPHNQQQQHSHSEREQHKQYQQQDHSSPRPSSQSSFDWKSSTSTPLNSKSSTTSTEASSVDIHNYNSRSIAEQSAVKIENMIPSQTQAATQPIYSTPFYPSDYSSVKTINHLSSSNYMSPYPSHTRPTIHDRRQSMMAGHNKLPNTPPMSDKSRDYQTQGHPSLAEEVSNSIQASQPSVGSWDPAQSQPNLPPLSEAINGISSVPSPSMAVSPPMQTQQAPLSTMNNVVASPPNFYAPAPYLDMQAPVQVYSSQDQLDADPSKMQPHGIPDRHSISGQSMVPQDSNANSGQYVRRVTYPFVHSLEPGTGLMMSNVIPSEPAGSSPLNSHSPFTHGGLVGASPVGMSRAAPAVDYMDSLGLGQAPHHHHSQASAHSQSPMHSIAWSQNGGGGGSDMSSVDGSVNGSKVYSFVPLSGVNSKKRPRRRFDEIERLYVCNWGDCEKAYGTLNHLNAHVNMQKHGPKRLPAEFKELRKAWRKHKRAEEEAAKQAAAFHQQQTQTQQAQLHQQQQQQQHHQQQSLCDPVLTHMHPAHHQLAMHAMTHHQPHQLPHPHAHPNQHSHQHTTHTHHPQSQHHSHPMGF